MTYLITCIDKKDALDLRLATRSEHIDYLKSIKEKLLLAGPILDENQNPKGTVLILDFNSIEEVKLFLDNDPYSQKKLFEKVNITYFKRVI
tara:strand:+ start:1517 stop:1789 length:273 start_codon:yes stop_codon:yes gene_type:complete